MCYLGSGACPPCSMCPEDLGDISETIILVPNFKKLEEMWKGSRPPNLMCAQVDGGH